MEQNLEVKKYEKEFPTMREHAEKMQVLTIGDVEPINEILQKIKERRIYLYSIYHDVTDAANIAHKKAKALENRVIIPYDELKDTLNKKVSYFFTEEKRKRDEKQRKIDLTAEKAEQKRKDELEVQAKRLEEKGDLKRAEERREKKEEVFIPPVVIPEMSRQIQGESGKLSMIPDIEIEIINEMQLAKEVVNGNIPLSCMEFKIGKIKFPSPAYKSTQR